MHVINLNDMLAGQQIRKTKLLSGSPIGMSQALKKDTLIGKLRLGKLVQSVLLEKKEIFTYMVQFFHGAIFSCSYRSALLCFVLF